MSEKLPPDLNRLGDALTTATEHAVRRRRRRADVLGRVAGTGVAGLLAFAALSPGVLGPANRDGGALLRFASAKAVMAPACETPRGGTFAQVRPCASPGATMTALVLERRYATP